MRCVKCGAIWAKGKIKGGDSRLCPSCSVEWFNEHSGKLKGITAKQVRQRAEYDSRMSRVKRAGR